MWLLLGAISSSPSSAPCCPQTNWKPSRSQATVTALFPASAGGKWTFSTLCCCAAPANPANNPEKKKREARKWGTEWPGWVGGRLLLSWGVQMLFFPCKAWEMLCAAMAATWER